MSIQMLTTVTECNGHFMTTLPFALFPFMKRDATCFQARETLTNAGTVKAMVIHLMCLLMLIRKMSLGSDVYKTSLKEVAAFFKPDVILTQNGADSHYYDPLTHLCGTTKIYREIPKIAHEIAHEYCQGRWIAVGGGGYDIWRVVPRAWSFIWLEMIERKAEGMLPLSWLEKWTKISLLTPFAQSGMMNLISISQFQENQK